MNSQTRKRASLWLGLVFVLGTAVGAVFGYNFAHRTYAAPAQLSEPERRAKRVKEMTNEIGLSPDQSQKLDAILQNAHAEIKKVRDSADSQVDAIRQQGREQARAMLTEEQKPKFEAFVRRLDEERKRQQQQTQGHPPH